MDRSNISRDTACQLLRECPRQGLTLIWCSFHRQGDNEPLTDATFALLGGVLGVNRSFWAVTCPPKVPSI